MSTYKGVLYMRRKLLIKRARVNVRYKFYEMKNIVQDFNISTPPDLRAWMGCLGWCAKAVDSLSDRLSFREFSEDNFNLTEIFNLNNPDTLFDSVILGALISACDFVYISPDADGYPRLQAIDGSNATGKIDPVTGLLTEGYAVLERDDYNNPILEAYFTGEATIYYRKGCKPEIVKHSVGYPLLVPVIYRPDAVRPFGHSRISRACMSIVGSAVRTVKRSEIAAEFFSYPQKYVSGLDSDAERMDKWKSTMAAMLAFTKDEDGDHPVVGQFAAQSMEPHLAQLKMFAGLFAGETGLTLDDLGFATDNPSSSDAIKAAHENLRLAARKAQRGFGRDFLNIGFLAACLRDDYPYKRQQFYKTKAKWEPLFEPDISQLAGIGDAIGKLQQSFPDYFTSEKLRDITGF